MNFSVKKPGLRYAYSLALTQGTYKDVEHDASLVRWFNAAIAGDIDTLDAVAVSVEAMRNEPVQNLKGVSRKENWTALSFAVDSGNKATLEFLLNKCACDASAEFSQAVFVAVRKNDTESLLKLLEYGADVTTAFTAALDMHQVEMGKAILDFWLKHLDENLQPKPPLTRQFNLECIQKQDLFAFLQRIDNPDKYLKVFLKMTPFQILSCTHGWGETDFAKRQTSFSAGPKTKESCFARCIRLATEEDIYLAFRQVESARFGFEERFEVELTAMAEKLSDRSYLKDLASQVKSEKYKVFLTKLASQNAQPVLQQ